MFAIGFWATPLCTAASATAAAAIFIASLIAVARTSSAPRKMKGKPSTLLTWLGKSERPVAMIASGRASIASGGQISGSGLAMAKMIGSFAIEAIIDLLTTFA